ncbi:hypothetical protein L6R52_34460 [Myxococcota bacterium]|nr:hypothetical protein [Myxococcota bacterium]
MNLNILVQSMHKDSKLIKTAQGRKVVENHIEATRKRFDNARGPERDKLRHELNRVIYTYNKARGY